MERQICRWGAGRSDCAGVLTTAGVNPADAREAAASAGLEGTNPL